MLMTSELRRKLPLLYSQDGVKDPVVHAKFFNPYGSGTWLITEFDGQDTMFGYVMGLGGDEWGYISLRELEFAKGPFPGVQGIERDAHFKPQPFSRAKHASKMASGAPSAEDKFFNNPRKREVREFAEAGALSNDVEVARDAALELGIPRSEAVADARKAPPTPTEIVQEPGGEQFSTLNRFLVETEVPVSGVPEGHPEVPKHPII